MLLCMGDDCDRRQHFLAIGTAGMERFRHFLFGLDIEHLNGCDCVCPDLHLPVQKTRPTRCHWPGRSSESTVRIEAGASIRNSRRLFRGF